MQRPLLAVTYACFPRCLCPGCLFSRAWHVVQFLVLVSDWLIASRGFDRLDVTGRLLITLCRCFKTVLEQNLSPEKEFDLHVNGPIGKTHFYLNGFARRRVLTQKQKTSSEMVDCFGLNWTVLKLFRRF